MYNKIIIIIIIIIIIALQLAAEGLLQYATAWQDNGDKNYKEWDNN